MPEGRGHAADALDLVSFSCLAGFDISEPSPPIRKAVFPVAGLETRFLPAIKVMPKELLPIIRSIMKNRASGRNPRRAETESRAGCMILVRASVLDDVPNCSSTPFVPALPVTVRICSCWSGKLYKI